MGLEMGINCKERFRRKLRSKHLVQSLLGRGAERLSLRDQARRHFHFKGYRAIAKVDVGTDGRIRRHTAGCGLN